MEQFLIVKTSSIGDVIQCFHIVKYLKKRFPKCIIDWVAERPPAPLLRAHPDIGQVLEIDTKRWRRDIFKNLASIVSFYKNLRKKNYDALFDLQGNSKSALVTAFAKANRKVGYDWNLVSEKINFFTTNVHQHAEDEVNIRNRNLRVVQDFFGDNDPIEANLISFKLNTNEESLLIDLSHIEGEAPRFMVCFGSNWRNKRVREKTLEELLLLIEKVYSPIFFFVYSNEQEKVFAEHLQQVFPGQSRVVGDLSLPLWQRLMQTMDLVMSMDSAALHLCATTTTPTFSFFGPSRAEAYKPLGEKHYAFQGACPYNIEFETRCPRLRTCPTGSCLHGPSAEVFFREFSEFWGKIQSPIELSSR